MVAVHGEESEQVAEAELALCDVRELMPYDVALWEEWVRASRGWRQMYWSPGLRKRLQAEMVSDAVAVAEAEAVEAEEYAQAEGQEVKPEPPRVVVMVTDIDARRRLARRPGIKLAIESHMNGCSDWFQAQEVACEILTRNGIEHERMCVALDRNDPVGMSGASMDSTRYRLEESRAAHAVFTVEDKRKNRVPLYPAPRVPNAAQLGLGI